MDPLDRDLALRLQMILLAWDFAYKETEMHRQRYLQLFAVMVTAGLVSPVSALLGGGVWPAGVGIAALLFTGSGFIHLRMRALPARLYRAYRVAMNAIGRLKVGDEPWDGRDHGHQATARCGNPGLARLGGARRPRRSRLEPLLRGGRPQISWWRRLLKIPLDDP